MDVTIIKIQVFCTFCERTKTEMLHFIGFFPSGALGCVLVALEDVEYYVYRSPSSAGAVST